MVLHHGTRMSPSAEPPGLPCVLALDIGMPTDAATPGLVQARFADLDAGLLARLRPVRVILPLLARTHDALAVVQRLEALGYTGQVTVIAPSLPDPRMVERELRSHGPGARLDVLSP